MKNLLSVLITLFISLNISANDYIVRSQVSDNEVSTEVITVYYFHASNRCKTCIALENETQKALKSLYSKKMKSGEIIFKSIDFDTPEGEKLAEKIKVNGQSLLFIKGDIRKDLTNDAFMYATTNTLKLKAKIKKTVDELI